MLKKCGLIVLLQLLCVVFYAQEKASAEALMPKASSNIYFTENLGQWDNNILLKAGLDGGVVFVERNCLTFNFYDKKKHRAIHAGALQKNFSGNSTIARHAYKMHFEGCNANPVLEKNRKGTHYENFFIGNDKSKWK